MKILTKDFSYFGLEPGSKSPKAESLPLLYQSHLSTWTYFGLFYTSNNFVLN